MTKKRAVLSRRNAIAALIKRYIVEDQEMLIDLLQKNYGIKTNQPAISRDLHELGVRKGVIGGKLVYELERDIEHEILWLAIVDVVCNEAVVIIKTMPGLAAFVGDFLDRQSNIEVLGTIAGENMVFVAPASIKRIRKTFEKVCMVVHFTKNKDKS